MFLGVEILCQRIEFLKTNPTLGIYWTTEYHLIFLFFGERDYTASPQSYAKSDANASCPDVCGSVIDHYRTVPPLPFPLLATK